MSHKRHEAEKGQELGEKPTNRERIRGLAKRSKALRKMHKEPDLRPPKREAPGPQRKGNSTGGKEPGRRTKNRGNNGRE